jgi:hypothetical protein
MWAVYDKDTGEILKTTHLKKSAKKWIEVKEKHSYYWAGTYKLIRFDYGKLGEIQTFLLLQISK